LSLPSLWQARLVSHTFKAAVETAFISRHLPRARVIFSDFYDVVSTHHGRVSDFRLDMTFDRLSEDGTRAFFEAKMTSLEEYVLRDKVLGREETVRTFLRDQWAEQLGRQAFPRHVLALGLFRGDSSLPGLVVVEDEKKFRISFLWRRALGRLFGEAEVQGRSRTRPCEEVYRGMNLKFQVEPARRRLEKEISAQGGSPRRVSIQERPRRIDEDGRYEKVPRSLLVASRSKIVVRSHQIEQLHPTVKVAEEATGIHWRPMARSLPHGSTIDEALTRHVQKALHEDTHSLRMPLPALTLVS
jgi:hypothetical protein